MACLFSTDSFKICLLGRIIIFLPLRFIYKHMDEKKCFGNPIVLGVNRLSILGCTESDGKKNLEKQKMKSNYSVVNRQIRIVTS